MPEMKPEHNYGLIPRFQIDLLPDNNLKNRVAVLKIIRDTQPEYRDMKIIDLGKRYREFDVVMSWSLKTRAEKQNFVQQLEAAQATFTVKDIPIPISIPPDVTYNRHYERIAYSQEQGNERFASFEARHNSALELATRHTNGVSQVLETFGEYSLQHWAQANQIAEAYRFTEMPSFEPYKTLRVWWMAQAVHAVYQYGWSKDYPPEPVVTHHWQITPADRAYLRTFMAQHFWNAKSWYSVGLSCLLTDGTFYIFEGWRDNTYKYLDEHGPNPKHISYEAAELFNDIIRAYKPPLP